MTALKAHEVERFLKKPDLAEGVFLAYGPDAGLVREVGQLGMTDADANDVHIERGVDGVGDVLKGDGFAAWPGAMDTKNF